jgi:hypothetical protein
MRRLSRAVVLATLFAVAGGTLAFAVSPTVEIDGRTYGPLEGLEIETRSVEIKPGSGPIVAVFGGPTAADTETGSESVVPLITWGSSYAITVESWQFFYDGRAKAAANIYSSKRIIQVCIWYERAGAVISAKRCSNADGNTGTWRPGPEVTVSATDSLGLFDPPTEFKWSRVLINPGLLP